MLSFRAGVQYGDWDGSVAADDRDFDKTLGRFLEDRQLLSEEEFLLAASLSVIEGSPYVTAYIYAGDNQLESVKDAISGLHEIPVREVRLEVSTEDFLRFFKRFNVMLTWKSLELTDRKYRPIDG
jgi:hypothetical protein